MRSKFIFAFFSLCLSVTTNYAQTHVFGTSAENNGKAVIVYTLSDPICSEKIILGSDTIRNNGEFKISCSVNETVPVYIDWGRITLFFYAEKDKSLEIVLPKFQKRTEYEEHSSFFRPEQHYVGIKSVQQDSNNSKIRRFDQQFYQSITENRGALTGENSSETIASIEEKLRSEFPTESEANNYFEIHQHFRFVELSLIDPKIDLEKAAIKAFRSRDYSVHQIAYSKVFNKLFTNYLMFQSRQIKNESLKRMLHSGDRAGLEQYLIQKGFDKDLVPFIILKTYKDAIGDQSIKSETALQIINSYNSHNNSKIRDQAKRIANRSFRMTIGSMAPNFSLQDDSNETKTLSSFGGKYLYLCFLKSGGGEYLKEKLLLEQMAKQFQQFLQVAVVFTDKLPENINRSKSVFYLNLEDNRSILDSYLVDSQAKYYLIGDKGTVLQSPAVSPSEGFSASFLRYYREKLMNEHRKQVRSKN